MAEIASAFVTIAPSAKGFGSKLNSEVGSSVQSSGTSLGRTFGRLFALGAGVIAAAGIGNLLKGSIDEAREAQKVGAQTNAVLKSTGGVANVTASQVGNLASALSAKIGVDDEAIQAGENMLLTFSNVRNEAGKGNDIFNQATRTVQDMAAAFGGDATSNSKILGKALNDPVKGVSALTRVGVSFTDGQKEQIKSLVESGDTMGAQKVILGELAKQTQGSAAAQVTASDKAKVAFGNLKETIGTALLPVIDKLAGIFTDKIAPAIQTFVGQLQSGEGAGGKVADIFGTVASVLGTLFGFINQNRTVTAVFIGSIVAMTVAFTVFNAVVSANPISLVIIAIAALAAGLVYAYKHSETFRNVVQVLFAAMKKGFSVVAKAFGAMFGFIKDHWRLIITILGGPIGLAVALISKHWDKIKAGGLAVFNWVKKNWPGVKLILTKAFEEAKQKIGPVWTALRQGASRVKEVLTRAFAAVASAIQGAIDKAETLLQKLHLISQEKGSAVKGHGRTSAGGVLGGSIATDLVDGTKGGLYAAQNGVNRAIDDFAKKTGKKLKEQIKKLRDQLATVTEDFASLVEPIASNFTQGLFDFDTADAFKANLTKTQGWLQLMIANFNKLKGEGLSAGFLYKLFESGGPALINSLAALPAGDALSAGNLFGDVMSLGDQLGTAVAGSTQKGGELQHQTDVLSKKLDKLIASTNEMAHRTGEVINGAAANGHRRGKSNNGGRRGA